METHEQRQRRQAQIETILRAAWREVGAAWWQEKLYSENGAKGLVTNSGYLDPYLFAGQCGALPPGRAMYEHGELSARIKPYLQPAA